MSSAALMSSGDAGCGELNQQQVREAECQAVPGEQQSSNKDAAILEVNLQADHKLSTEDLYGEESTASVSVFTKVRQLLSDRSPSTLKASLRASPSKASLSASGVSSPQHRVTYGRQWSVSRGMSRGPSGAASCEDCWLDEPPMEGLYSGQSTPEKSSSVNNSPQKLKAAASDVYPTWMTCRKDDIVANSSLNGPWTAPAAHRHQSSHSSPCSTSNSYEEYRERTLNEGHLCSSCPSSGDTSGTSYYDERESRKASARNSNWSLEVDCQQGSRQADFYNNPFAQLRTSRIQMADCFDQELLERFSSAQLDLHNHTLLVTPGNRETAAGHSLKELYKKSFEDEASSHVCPNIGPASDSGAHSPLEVIESYFADPSPSPALAGSREFRLPSLSRTATDHSSEEDLSTEDKLVGDGPLSGSEDVIRTSEISSHMDAEERTWELRGKDGHGASGVARTPWTMRCHQCLKNTDSFSRSLSDLKKPMSVSNGEEIQKLSETLLQLIAAVNAREDVKSELLAHLRPTTHDVCCGTDMPVLMSSACSSIAMPNLTDAATEVLDFYADGAVQTDEAVMVDTAVGDAMVTRCDSGVQTEWDEALVTPMTAKTRVPSKAPRLMAHDADLVTRRAMRMKRRARISRERSRAATVRAFENSYEGLWYPVGMLTVAIVLPLVGFALRRIRD